MLFIETPSHYSKTELVNLPLKRPIIQMEGMKGWGRKEWEGGRLRVKLRERQTERETDRQTERERDRERDRQTERETDRERERQTERETDRERDRAPKAAIHPSSGCRCRQQSQ